MNTRVIKVPSFLTLLQTNDILSQKKLDYYFVNSPQKL